MVAINIPIQLFLLSFSLKNNSPIKDEEITISILTIGKTIELGIEPSFSASKKNNNEKKFGIPKAIPHIIFLA